MSTTEQPTGWDRSGLKEACQRALKIGRTHQEVDIQLFLDMLLRIEQLERALTTHGEAVRAETWQAIETVPKDGTEILMTDGKFRWVDTWSPDGYHKDGGVWEVSHEWPTGSIPSHWMPLPAPPALAAGEKGE